MSQQLLRGKFGDLVVRREKTGRQSRFLINRQELAGTRILSYLLF